MAELSPGSVCITNLWAAITARSRLVHLSVKRFKQIAVFTTTFSGQNDFTAGRTVVSFHRRNNGGLPFIRYLNISGFGDQICLAAAGTPHVDFSMFISQPIRCDHCVHHHENTPRRQRQPSDEMHCARHRGPLAHARMASSLASEGELERRFLAAASPSQSTCPCS